jgi:DNA-directed RNA polymerase subunit K/omega
VSAPPAPGHALVQDRTNTPARDNRFLLSAIAFQRSKQLHAGAAARIARGAHKATYTAVLEVLADTVSWSLD